MNPISVVIVDDDPHMMQYYHAVLGKVDGIKTVAATTVGRRVVSLVAQTRPDIVLLDYAMYPINGFQLMDAIYQSLPDVAVILLGGRETLREAALQAGATDYLAVPITPKILVEAVRRVGWKSRV